MLSINKEEYFNYIKYIDEYKATYDTTNLITVEFFTKLLQNIKIKKEIFNFFFDKISIFPYQRFIELDEECKKIVLKSENDSQQQFIVGQSLV